MSPVAAEHTGRRAAGDARGVVAVAASLAALLAGASPPTGAAEYHVSPAGRDANPGTARAPFASLQRGLDALRPGDTCFLHAGVYRQSAVLRVSGEPNRPVRIEAWGADVVVLSGTEPLAGPWRPHRGGILRTTCPRPVRQLFVDGELMTPARWPNMPFARRWDPNAWRKSAAGTHYGVMVDPALAETGIDFTGAVATLNIGSWQTFRRVVRRHGRGADRFTYDRDETSRLAREKPHRPGFDRYFLTGPLAALDCPGEWFHDRPTGALYLWPPPGKSPPAAQVEAKVRPYALTARGVRHVVVRGLGFFATSLKFEDASHCRLENLHFRFPHGLYEPFGPPTGREPLDIEPRDWTSRRWFGQTSVVTPTFLGGQDNVLAGCSIAFANGPAVVVAGRRNTLEDCLLHDIDWCGLDTGLGVDLLGCSEATVRHCTIFNMGSSEGVRLSNRGASVVEYCYIHHGGLCQSDGALVQCATPGVAGTVLRYNWVHDHNAFNYGGTGLRGDDRTRGLIVHHNVAWRCREKGIIVKGDNNRVYNNTCLDNPRRDILLPIRRLPGKTRELPLQNAHSQAVNNCARVSGRYTWERKDDPPAAYVAANCPRREAMLVDPGRLDFRPRAGSPLIDAGREIPGITDGFLGRAPDIGAYEFGAPRWVPGYRNAVAVFPAANGAVRVRLAMPTLKALALAVHAGNSPRPLQVLTFTPADWMHARTVRPPSPGGPLRLRLPALGLDASVDPRTLPDPRGTAVKFRTIP